MKIIYYIGIILFAWLQVTCHSFGEQKVYEQTKFERKPFQRSPHIIKQPEAKSYREIENGKTIDIKTRVIEVDKKAGKYEFRWIGYDGKEKVVEYQRHDAIDAIVEASVKKDPDGRLVYKYDFKMLGSSPTYFHAFYVQAFTSKKPDPVNLDKNRFMLGRMASVHIFKEGVWWDLGFIGQKEERIHGGSSITFKLASLSPPGIVGSKAIGGEWALVGSGEHVPTLLENQIPTFEDLATGYTIGPDERLSKFSDSEKLKYLLENLPKFQEAGWMSEGTAKNYEQILKENDLKRVLAKAKKDFENEFVSSEVFHIIEGLSR